MKTKQETVRALQTLAGEGLLDIQTVRAALPDTDPALYRCAEAWEMIRHHSGPAARQCHFAYGPCGTGKTHWARCLLTRCKHRGWEVAENVLAHGTGGINVGACRVGTEVVGWNGARGGSEDLTQSQGRNYRLGEGDPRPAIGRWPANIIHDGSAEVLAAFPESNSRSTLNSNERYKGKQYAGEGYYGRIGPENSYSDSRSVARFFYCAKASRADRDDGLAGFEMRNGGELTGRKDGAPGTQNPRAGAGGTSGGRNTHPTVKPTDLMRYLCRLVTPPDGLILDPFAGSGSTGRGAVLEGFNFIGIELNPDYADMARAIMRK